MIVLKCTKLKSIFSLGKANRSFSYSAFPTLDKFAKISHNRAEYRPKVGQNSCKQWIFYQAVPRFPLTQAPLFALNFVPDSAFYLALFRV